MISNIVWSVLIYGVLSVLYLKGVRFPYFLHAVKMFPFFYCGALCGMSDRVKRLFTESRTVYAVALAVYFVLVLTGTNVNIISLTGLPAIIVLMNLFSRYDAKIPSLLAMVGTYSLEIYVFHWFLIPSLPWVAPLLTKDMGTWLFNINIIVLFLFTLTIATVIVAACMALAIAVKHSPFLAAVFLGETKT